MNAAMLDYPYRLIDSVNNHAKIDCSHKSTASNDSCHACLEETSWIQHYFRTGLPELLKGMLADYERKCRDHTYTAPSRAAAIRRMIPYHLCELDDDIAKMAVDSLLSYFATATVTHEYSYDYSSPVKDLIANAFGKPYCLQEELLKSFQNTSGQGAAVGNCYDQFHKIGGNVWDFTGRVKFCRLYSSLKLLTGQYLTEDFRAGILFKYTRVSDKSYPIDALENFFLKDVLFAQKHIDIPYGSWRWIPCLHDFVMFKHEKYCKMTQQDWPGNLDLLYRVMKQRVAPISMVATEKSELKVIEKAKNRTQKIRGNSFIDEPVWNDHAVIMACKYGKEEMTTQCDKFSNVFSSMGIGYSFNTVPYWAMHKNTTGNFAFYKEQYEKAQGFEKERPRMIRESGDAFEFIIRHQPYGYEYDEENRPATHQKVLLSLHDPGQIPNLKIEGLTIRPGMSYDIRVNPKVTITDETAMSLDNKTRNCLSTSDNVHLHSFRRYSQSACLWECRLRQATNACNCTAWNFPRVQSSASICFYQESIKCFSSVMDSKLPVSNCECLNDCEHILYDVDVHVSVLDYKWMDSKPL